MIAVRKFGLIYLLNYDQLIFFFKFCQFEKVTNCKRILNTFLKGMEVVVSVGKSGEWILAQILFLGVGE